MYYVVCKSCGARWEAIDQPSSCMNEECEAGWMDLPMFADKADADRVASQVVPSERDDVYMGSFFNVDRAGENWIIWRLVDDNGTREEIALSQAGMDDLRDYFADFYAEDRAEARAEITHGDENAFDLDPRRDRARSVRRSFRRIAARGNPDKSSPPAAPDGRPSGRPSLFYQAI